MINKSIKYSPKLKALGFLGKSRVFSILKPRKHALFYFFLLPSPHKSGQVGKSKSPVMEMEISVFRCGG